MQLTDDDPRGKFPGPTVLAAARAWSQLFRPTAFPVFTLTLSAAAKAGGQSLLRR